MDISYCLLTPKNIGVLNPKSCISLEILDTRLRTVAVVSIRIANRESFNRLWIIDTRLN